MIDFVERVTTTSLEALTLRHFLKISKHLEQGNFFSGTLGKFCPLVITFTYRLSVIMSIFI